MYRIAILLLLPALASGCYHTRAVSVQSLSGVERGNHTHELLFVSPEGQRVRLGPRSKIRFLRTDGLWTAWVRGYDLRVNAEGVFHRGRPHDYQLAGLRWSQVRGVEVENLNGAKTYGVVLGATIIVAAVLVMLLGAGKGGGGGGGGKLGGLGRGAGSAGRGLARGAGSAARGIGHAMARGSYNLARALSRGWRWYGPDLHLHIGGHVDTPVYDPAAPIPGQTEPAPMPQPGAPPPPPPPPAAAPVPPSPASGPLVADVTSTASLFSSFVKRQASLKLVGAIEGGGDLYYHDGGTFLAYAGLRFANVLELGGGALLLRHRGSETVTPQELRSSWMGFGRLLLHLDIDSARRVALPLGVDLGSGQSRIHVRTILGIRVRLWDQLSLGLYPFNPTYTQFKDNDLRRSVGWWSFPTTLELSYAF
ncbi:MAG: hypothetical protein RBU30_05210 [Polyangia bacterium]|nr:hypothetical protein [Polyangia bacterium]